MIRSLFHRFKTKKIRNSLVKDAGPYALLTQEELISLVLQQESQLVVKSKKISELEQYIDNLLVRIIEEAPNVLMTMTPLK
uniref:FIP-RBD domain-containing protein n=1 Tax=Neogobius melanostomus TaxID=47308 RepID=A0A8C6T0A2_9GOBI